MMINGARELSYSRVWVSAGLLLLALLLLGLATVVVNAPLIEWNGARALFPMALVCGEELYPLPGNGPLLGNYYGPVMAVLFSPIAWMAETPTQLLVAASVVNLMLFSYAAVAPVLSGIDMKARPSMVYWLVVPLTLGCHVMLPASFYMIHMVHADALALALVVASCLLLIAPDRALNHRRLWWAALAASAAMLTKQTAIFAIPAQIAYLWLASGVSAVRAYSWRLGLTAVAAISAACLVFGAENLWYHTVLLPGRTPWHADISQHALLGTLRQAGFILGVQAPMLVVLLLGWRVGAKEGSQAAGPSERAREHPETMWVLLAVCFLPISILSLRRYGGDANSDVSSFFMLTASILAVIGMFTSTEQARRQIGRIIVGAGLLLLPLLVVSTLFLHSNSRYWKIPLTLALGKLVSWEKVEQNPNHQAYVVARANPGQLLFPWYPLATLMAENKLWHLQQSLHDHELITGSTDPDWVTAHLPSRPRWIAYHPTDQHTGKAEYYLVQRYYRRYRGPTRDALLPGWELFQPPISDDAGLP